MRLIDKILEKMCPPFTHEERVLDHGYVKVIETWGSDQAVIEDARMSTDKGFLGWDPGPCPVCNDGEFMNYKNIPDCKACNGSGQVMGDAKLLKYLYNHKHMTPFEGSGMKIEVVAPIFVFREWHRHRTQSYNEMSARYTPLPDVNYLPSVERCIVVPGSNKQAGNLNNESPDHDEVLDWLRALEHSYRYSEQVYQSGLSIGIPKEIARLPVTVARYSKMRATANLRNWLAFLTLREDQAAQYEIREYAHVVSRIIAKRYPRTFDLYVASRLNSLK